MTNIYIFFVLFTQPDYDSIIKSCNLWRNFDDIQDSWQSVASVIDYYGDNQDTIIQNAGPGHWNDPDMVRHGWLNARSLNCLIRSRKRSLRTS